MTERHETSEEHEFRTYREGCARNTFESKCARLTPDGLESLKNALILHNQTVQAEEMKRDKRRRMYQGNPFRSQGK